MAKSLILRIVQTLVQIPDVFLPARGTIQMLHSLASKIGSVMSSLQDCWEES